MGELLFLDTFYVHRTPSSRRVFSGTRLELMTCRSRACYLTTRLLWLQMTKKSKQEGESKLSVVPETPTVTHTQSPIARINVPLAYLLHVNGAHTNPRDQNAYNPRYGFTKWMELCHQHPGTAFVRIQIPG
ncbi:hypothetical protein TNCV_2113141 [Trichonephila clavipes]|nr:hypothetical protein TNCV_2113141 [Trichonephila clavipes]